MNINKKMTSRPDFLILGAPKCGTTSVYHYLRQHPNVYLCPKETHYFVRNDPGYTTVQTRSWEAYSKLFASAEGSQLRGEVAVRYLYSESARNEIRKRLPECKLAVFIREPVSRTISQYLMRFRTGGAHPTDGGVLPNEKEIRDFFGNHNHDIIQWSQYHKYLVRWYESFPEGHVRVFLLEQLETEPVRTMAEFCKFVGLGGSHQINTTVRYNVSTTKDFNPFIVRLKRIQILRNLRNSRTLRMLARIALPRQLRDQMIWRPQKAAAHISEKLTIPNDVKESLQKHFMKERHALRVLTGQTFAEWDGKSETA